MYQLKINNGFMMMMMIVTPIQNKEKLHTPQCSLSTGTKLVIIMVICK